MAVTETNPSAKRWTRVWADVQTAAKVIETLGKFAVVVTIALWIWERPQREQASIYQAWQVINLAAGQHGSGGRIEALQDLNAKHVDLANLNMPNANLTKVRLQQAELAGADFRGAVLNKADLRESDLSAADFSGHMTKLEGTQFDGAYMLSAKFDDAILQSVSFGVPQRTVRARDTVLLSASFRNATLSKVDFTSAELQAADFTYANGLELKFKEASAGDAHFLCSSLNVIQFDGARLAGADFSRSSLSNATFVGADLDRTVFDRVALVNVDFTDAKHFEAASLRNALVVSNVVVNGKRLRDRGVLRDVPRLCPMRN